MNRKPWLKSQTLALYLLKQHTLGAVCTLSVCLSTHRNSRRRKCTTSKWRCPQWHCTCSHRCHNETMSIEVYESDLTTVKHCSSVFAKHPHFFDFFSWFLFSSDKREASWHVYSAFIQYVLPTTMGHVWTVLELPLLRTAAITHNTLRKTSGRECVQLMCWLAATLWTPDPWPVIWDTTFSFFGKTPSGKPIGLWLAEKGVKYTS